jgi:uncharacterized membrane protein
VIEKSTATTEVSGLRPRTGSISQTARTQLLVHASTLSLVASAVLVVMLVVGTVLRFWNINAMGYNSDEAVYTGQAAALAGDPNLSTYFPIIRAHPMVFQFILSVVFGVFGVHDIIGRSLVAIIGIITVLLVYRAARDLYGHWTGVIAASMMAAMPYHVIVTRQVLLDGPLTFCTTLTLLLLIRYAITGRTPYLLGVGAALGLVFLTKETGFVLAAAAFAFLALCPEIKIRFWPLVGAGVCMLIPMAMYPVSITLAGRSDTAQSYIIWQLLRRPNHDWKFFPTVVPPAIGWLVLLTAVAGLILLRKSRTWREVLLVCWIVVPTVVFQIWPVKGFQYLLPIAPAMAILAARALTQWRPQTKWSFLSFPLFNGVLATIIVASLVIPSWEAVSQPNASSRLAGAGGIPGVRETGLWIDAYLPEDAVLVTVGPSMANMIQFYGNRKAYGLSVSTNPLHRNPSYQPLANPDASLRYGEAQYLVYDSFSASRSKTFSESLMSYVDKYSAKEVYSFSIHTPDQPGGTKIIIIYEVRP